MKANTVANKLVINKAMITIGLLKTEVIIGGSNKIDETPLNTPTVKHWMSTRLAVSAFDVYFAV